MGRETSSPRCLPPPQILSHHSSLFMWLPEKHLLLLLLLFLTTFVPAVVGKVKRPKPSTVQTPPELSPCSPCTTPFSSSVHLICFCTRLLPLTPSLPVSFHNFSRPQKPPPPPHTHTPHVLLRPRLSCSKVHLDFPPHPHL